MRSLGTHERGRRTSRASSRCAVSWPVAVYAMLTLVVFASARDRVARTRRCSRRGSVLFALAGNLGWAFQGLEWMGGYALAVFPGPARLRRHCSRVRRGPEGCRPRAPVLPGGRGDGDDSALDSVRAPLRRLRSSTGPGIVAGESRRGRSLPDEPACSDDNRRSPSTSSLSSSISGIPPWASTELPPASPLFVPGCGGTSTSSTSLPRWRGPLTPSRRGCSRSSRSRCALSAIAAGANRNRRCDRRTCARDDAIRSHIRRRRTALRLLRAGRCRVTLVSQNYRILLVATGHQRAEMGIVSASAVLTIILNVSSGPRSWGLRGPASHFWRARCCCSPCPRRDPVARRNEGRLRHLVRPLAASITMAGVLLASDVGAAGRAALGGRPDLWGRGPRAPAARRWLSYGSLRDSSPPPPAPVGQ